MAAEARLTASQLQMDIGVCHLGAAEIVSDVSMDRFMTTDRDREGC